jgi:hypothetical protein
MSATLRVDRLIGREVHTAGKRRVGRLEEFRAVRRGNSWIVTEYVIGAAGLTERLGLGARQILGMKQLGGYVARWDQLDLSNPDHLRLTCALEDLRRQ